MSEIRMTVLLGAAILLALFINSTAIFIQAQTPIIDPNLKPDVRRAQWARPQLPGPNQSGRKGGYVPLRIERGDGLTHRSSAFNANQPARVLRATTNLPAANPITPGTALSRVLHTSQISLVSSAGSDEQFVDRDRDLTAEERTTFDFSGGSFDIAVGVSGARYEGYSATLNNTHIGVLALALDTNGDYRSDITTTFDLHRDFSLPSVAAVVTGISRAGREFVIVSSSGYYNANDPNDPNNEPSPGVVLLIRDPANGGFDNARSRVLVTVGDNRLYNANGLTLLPNNDLLIADFHSDEIRIIRDSDNDGLPDTLDPAPYYSYRFSDDAPLDIAANSRGVLFSHSAGNDTLMLAVYDTNGDGIGDVDEVVVEGLSIDDNLFLHGLTVDRLGNIYVIEDASGSSDDSNGGRARIDLFPDGSMNGFLSNGSVFIEADAGSDLALSGLALGTLPHNQINDTAFFIHEQYFDFLNREPDAGGLAYWSAQIDECGNRNDRCVNSRRIGVSAAFFVEQEFQNTGSFVYRLYKGGLGRKPTYAQFLQDRAIVLETDREASKQALTLAFVQRAEFVQRYASSVNGPAFVDSLITTIRQASNLDISSQRQSLIDKYSQGSDLVHSRALVLRGAVESTAFVNAEYNASFVLMQYFGYLNRDIDQGGYDFWLNVLNNRVPNNYRSMVCAFITSREYQERFGDLLRRSNADCAE